MLCCCAVVGVEMFTSSFFLLYSHCVLPSNHIMALLVRALNLLPLMAMVPLCVPKLPPDMVKLALTPFDSPILADALSRVAFAVAALLAAWIDAVVRSAMINDNSFFISLWICRSSYSVS